MNNAPLYNALKVLAARNTTRLHMPGHKGRALFHELDSIYDIDYTETYGTGNLFEGNEPILSAEKAAARYFGAQDCLFLTGGSTQALMTAIYTASCGNSHMIVDRNCHKAVSNAMALLDITPHFLFPKVLSDFGFTERINISHFEEVVKENPQALAVLITSPNYYGVCQDIAAISAICKKHGKVLIVDEAHGAHFPATGTPNAISQGADLVAVSAHKTLPALGQCAFLLSSGRFAFEELCSAAAIFGTSSPSYLLLSSLDLSRAYMEEKGGAEYRQTAKLVAMLRERINNSTVFTALCEKHIPFLDPCRLTVSCRSTDITGHQLSDMLFEKYNIAAEMADENNVVFIFTCTDTQENADCLLNAFTDCGVRKSTVNSNSFTAPFPQPKRRCSVREALFSPAETIAVAESLGRVCARAVTSYPPGVPILYPGEEVEQLHIEFLSKQCYTTVKEISVIP